jgi:hypothetical protein
VRQALSAEVLREAKLELISPSAGKPRFAGQLSDIVSRAAGIRVAPQQTGVDEDLVSLIQAYATRCHGAGFIEPGEAARELAVLAPALPGPVAFNRFADLSRTQIELILVMAAANEIGVALNWEAGCPATAALDRVVDVLAAAATAHHREGTRDPATELEFLERDLYRPAAPIKPTGELILAEAAGPEAEVAVAARMAARFVSQGVPAERVAIVFRDVARRTHLIHAALANQGLVGDLDVSRSFVDTPFGRAVSALLDASCAYADTRERLLAFLTSPYSDASGMAVEQLDRQWRRSRLTGIDLLDSAQTRLGRDVGAPLARARKLLGLSVDESSVREWKRLADSLLRSACGSTGITSVDRVIDGAAHRSFIEAVSSLATGLPAPTVRGAWIRELLSALRVTSGAGERPGAIQVTEAHRLRSRRFDALIVGGLDATEFSADRPPSAVQGLLQRIGVEPTGDTPAHERMLFYSLVSRARNHLVLLRQTVDSAGRERRPSVFWDEVLDLYGRREDPDAAPDGLPLERAGLRETLETAPSYTAGRPAIRRSASRCHEPVERGRLGQSAMKRITRDREYTVSELETYLACPYRWFMERALRPEGIDSTLGAREAGSHAHRVLAGFYGAWRSEPGRARVSPGNLDEALEVFDRIAAREAATAHPATDDVEESLRIASAGTWARGIIIDDADWLPGFEPLHHELEFGEAADRPMSLGAVRIKGRIDRIDASSSELVVTDYKSGSSVRGHQSFEKHGLIQVAVYAQVAQEACSLPVGAAWYRSLRTRAARGYWIGDSVNPGTRGSTRDRVEREVATEIVSAAVARAGEAAAGISAGVITRRPEFGACGYCPIRRLCDAGGKEDSDE